MSTLSQPAITFPTPYIIEVIGNVAAGKTTFAKKIAKLSNAVYIDTDLYLENPFLSLYVHQPKRWAFSTGIQFSHQRAQRIDYIMKKMAESPIVLDHGFHMGINVYSRHEFLEERMTDDEWKLLQSVHEALMKSAPEIALTVFLDVPVPILMERIKQRGRKHEQEYSTRYVTQLEKRFHEYRDTLKKKKHALLTYIYKKDDFIPSGNADSSITEGLKKIWHYELAHI